MRVSGFGLPAVFGALTGDGFPPFTFGVSADGVLNYGQILGQINEKISKGIGIPGLCKDINDPLGGSTLPPPPCESAAFKAPGGVSATDLPHNYGHSECEVIVAENGVGRGGFATLGNNRVASVVSP